MYAGSFDYDCCCIGVLLEFADDFAMAAMVVGVVDFALDKQGGIGWNLVWKM